MTDAPIVGALPPPPIDILRRVLGDPDLQIAWLAGDGSDRTYYRLRLSRPDERTCVLMQLSRSDAEALNHQRYDWVHLAETLSKVGIRVPKLWATLNDYGALVIEDYGDVTFEALATELLKTANHHELVRAYVAATEIINAFLCIAPQQGAVWMTRAFDQERLEWELDFFLNEYASPVGGLKFSEEELETFHRECTALSQFIAKQSQVFVHRDYHSRNLMVLGAKEGDGPPNLAVIDFQDARLGPAAYDLVSLCFDSYVPMETDLRKRVFGACFDAMTSAHPNLAASIEATWRAVLLQRQLKAIGSFGYLTLRKRRGDYLKYVPQARRIVAEAGVADDRWPFLSDTLLGRLGGK